MDICKNGNMEKLEFWKNRNLKELRSIKGNRENKENWINEIGNDTGNFNHSKNFLNIGTL